MKENIGINQESVISTELFNPENFGFEKQDQQGAWRKNVPGVGPIIVSKISWEHVHHNINKTDNSINSLELTRQIQESIFDMEPVDTVPSNTLAIIEKTGGAALVAYREDQGYTPDGWLGIIIGFGSKSGTLVSHMSGVKEEFKKKFNIGWNLKIIQAHEALKSGHDGMRWTYDLFRGENANLNFRKLGGIVKEFVIDQYGALGSGLYGNVPTDRFVVEWNLNDQKAHKRVNIISKGERPETNLNLLNTTPQACLKNIDKIQTGTHPKVLFKIPGDIQSVSSQDEILIRKEARVVLSRLIDTTLLDDSLYMVGDPSSISTKEIKGKYFVADFLSFKDKGEFKNYYVLELK